MVESRILLRGPLASGPGPLAAVSDWGRLAIEPAGPRSAPAERGGRASSAEGDAHRLSRGGLDDMTLVLTRRAW